VRRLWETQPRYSTAEGYCSASLTYANILYELGDEEAAREAYRETLRIAHELLAPIPDRADDAAWYTGMGSWIEKRVTQQQRNENPKGWLSFIQLTCPFPELCDYEHSLELYTELTKFETLDSDQQIELAMAWYRTGQLDKALLSLQRLRVTSIEHGALTEADRLLWQCRILLDLGRLDEAQQALSAAQTDPAFDGADSETSTDSYLIRKRLFQECSEILARGGSDASL
jgi:hypothetical protein